MLVALDANIWVKERMLRSAMGAALLYAVRRMGGRIVLPAVTRAEALHQIVEAGLQAVTKVESGLATVQAIVGERPDFILPSRGELLMAAEARLSEIEGLLLPVEAGLADYEAATDRVIQGRPPNERKEQFRDSLFLQLLLPLAQKQTVHVVSEDSDFYEGGGERRRIAELLQRELRDLGADIQFSRGLVDFLDSLGSEGSAVDSDLVCSALQGAITLSLEEIANGKGYRLGAVQSARIDAYVTERSDVLAVSFELVYEAFDIPRNDGSVEPEGKLVAEGNANFGLGESDVKDVQLGKITVYGAHGDILSGHTHVFITGSIVIGTRRVPYSVRRRLPSANEQARDQRG